MIQTFVRMVDQVGGGRTEQFGALGGRGGILLNINFEWIPRSYWNSGTENEQPRALDLHCTVYDTLTNLSLIGQVQGARSLVIPSFRSVEWQNPYDNEIRSAMPMISKLGIVAVSVAAPGAFGGNIGITFVKDPNYNQGQEAGCIVTIELLSFDAGLS